MTICCIFNDVKSKEEADWEPVVGWKHIEPDQPSSALLPQLPHPQPTQSLWNKTSLVYNDRRVQNWLLPPPFEFIYDDISDNAWWGPHDAVNYVLKRLSFQLTPRHRPLVRSPDSGQFSEIVPIQSAVLFIAPSFEFLTLQELSQQVSNHILEPGVHPSRQYNCLPS